MKDKIKILMERHINLNEKGIVGCWDVVTKILSYIYILEIIIQSYKYRIGYFKYKEESKIEGIVDDQDKKKTEVDNKMDKLYNFIEIWVVGHSFLALLGSLLIFYYFTGEQKVLIYTILIYGLFRVFEIIIKQIRVIIFDTIGVNAIPLK